MKKIIILLCLLTSCIFSYAQENILYFEEQFSNIRGVSTSLNEKQIPVSDDIDKNTATIILGEDMSFIGDITIRSDLSYINSTKGINNFTKKQQEEVTNFEWAKKYPKATEYINSETPFWFSYMATLIKKANDKPFLEREPYYWEIENYFNNKVVSYKNFYQQKDK